MARTKFKYNPVTCRYEPFKLRGKALRNRVLGFLSISLVMALAGYYFTIQSFQSFDEMLLSERNQKLKIQWSLLHDKIEKANQQLAELIDKDDNNYRVILDSNPLAPSIREAGIGGSEKINLKPIQAYPFIVADYNSLQKLSHQLDIEIQSFDELEKILNGKITAWATRPAIQPISNTDLQTLHLTYGARLHPIFKVWKDHKGLDFAAEQGTPVYATGDGKVTTTYYSESYGNVVYIDHGYDFETRYAHLSGFAVTPGEVVKRGQLVGYVGSTGHSVAPHLHYEILINGSHVNPINFFQRDLSNDEYQKLIDLGSENGDSLD
jgi:murein DD-endopeptidase MepM/ murein hydrolase activator NlpD